MMLKPVPPVHHPAALVLGLEVRQQLDVHLRGRLLLQPECLTQLDTAAGLLADRFQRGDLHLLGVDAPPVVGDVERDQLAAVLHPVQLHHVRVVVPPLPRPAAAVAEVPTGGPSLVLGIELLGRNRPVRRGNRNGRHAWVSSRRRRSAARGSPPQDELAACSTVASGPGKTRPSWPSSDHRTRYGGAPSVPRTSRISASLTASPTCWLRTTSRSPTSARIAFTPISPRVNLADPACGPSAGA